MNFYRILAILLAAGLLFSNCNRNKSEEDPHHSAAETSDLTHSPAGQSPEISAPQKLKLPEHLLTVLRKEMQLIEAGMGELLAHLARGNAEEAQKTAEKIQHSFILKQSLSKAELKQLVSLLPKEFIQMDRTFHGNAGKVAEAVRQGDFNGAAVLYSDMAQSCVRCHTQFAAERFPALVKK